MCPQTRMAYSKSFPLIIVNAIVIIKMCLLLLYYPRSFGWLFVLFEKYVEIIFFLIIFPLLLLFTLRCVFVLVY